MFHPVYAEKAADDTCQLALQWVSIWFQFWSQTVAKIANTPLSKN